MRASLLMPFLLIAAIESASAKDVVRLCPGMTTMQNLFKKIESSLLKKEDISLVIATDPATTNAVGNMQALLQGKCDAAVNAADFQNWMKQMSDKGVAVDATKLTHRVISKDFVRAVVNPKAKVTELDEEKLARIFTGKVMNWKDVGGADLPIKVYLSKDKPTPGLLFQERVLKKAPFLSTANMVSGWKDVAKAVGVEAGGIGLVPHSEVPADGSVVIARGNEVGRPVTFVTIGKPSEAAQKLLRFIASDEGKALVEK